MSEQQVDYTYLSDGQEKAMSVLMVFSSILSILGSSTIIYKVLSDRMKATSYDRIMLGLSTCDLIASVGYALTPFFLPKETSVRVWAVGNNASCNFLGFMTQLAFSAVLYNGFLSYYYLFTIRYGVNRQRFARRYEPWIHAISFIFALSTALIGAAMGFFSEVQVGFGCWVNDYPRGCYEECKSEEIGWVYGITPVVFALFSLIINNTLVYLHVRKVFRTTVVVESERIIRQKIQKREVATQGLLYVATFLFCYWAPIAIRVIEAVSFYAVDETKIFWILLCSAALLPLQGFLNMFVYNRPNYSRVRAAYPNISILSAIRRACLDPKIPKLTEISTPSGASCSSKKRFPRKNFSSGLDLIREESDEASGGDDDASIHDQLYEMLRNSGRGLSASRKNTDVSDHDLGSTSPTEKMTGMPGDAEGSSDEVNVYDDEKKASDDEDTAPEMPRSSHRIDMDGSLKASTDDDWSDVASQ